MRRVVAIAGQQPASVGLEGLGVLLGFFRPKLVLPVFVGCIRGYLPALFCGCKAGGFEASGFASLLEAIPHRHAKIFTQRVNINHVDYPNMYRVHTDAWTLFRTSFRNLRRPARLPTRSA